jgi:hypothetical protein
MIMRINFSDSHYAQAMPAERALWSGKHKRHAVTSMLPRIACIALQIRALMGWYQLLPSDAQSSLASGA